MKFCLIIFTFLTSIHASSSDYYYKLFQSYPERLPNSHVLELHSKSADRNQNENPFESKFWVKSTSVKSDNVNCGNHIYCEFGYFCIVLTSIIFYQSFDNLTN